MNPYTVVLHTDGGERTYCIHGPGIDPEKWRYTHSDSAQAMCDLFNTIAAHAAKETK